MKKIILILTTILLLTTLTGCEVSAESSQDSKSEIVQPESPLLMEMESGEISNYEEVCTNKIYFKTCLYQVGDRRYRLFFSSYGLVEAIELHAIK